MREWPTTFCANKVLTHIRTWIKKEEEMEEMLRKLSKGLSLSQKKAPQTKLQMRKCAGFENMPERIGVDRRGQVKGKKETSTEETSRLRAHQKQ